MTGRADRSINVKDPDRMSKSFLTAAVLAGLMLIAVRPASAAAVEFFAAPTSETVTTGSVVDVTISAVNRGGGSLGAYEVRLNYNPTLLAPSAETFSGAPGDPMSLGSITSADTSQPGVVDLAAVSLLAASALVPLQPAMGFDLVTVEFNVTASGEAAFWLTGVGASDGNGNALTIVPEPSSLAIVAVPAIAALGLRRRAA